VPKSDINTNNPISKARGVFTKREPVKTREVGHKIKKRNRKGGWGTRERERKERRRKDHARV